MQNCVFSYIFNAKSLSFSIKNGLSMYSMFQYQIGQLYMIARHSLEQSGDGEGVEVIENKECTDETHGNGQYTEKHIHLSR